MKSSRALCFSLLLCFIFPILSYAGQLEDAKAAIKNEDFNKSYELLLPLAEGNYAEAQFLLGSLYINGLGVEKDDTKGLSWIMKAARQGYDQAELRAVSIYLELANRGDASAMYNLGYMCLHGWGGEQNPNVCIGWLERAAISGHVRSAKVLSGIYEKGTFGITPDEDKASYWSNLPAEFPAGIEGGLQTNPIFDSDAKEYILEDTTIIGERSLRPLQREWFKAEDLKFELFNSLNSTDEFDITCERRASTGSIISRRVCDVGYLKKARAEDARLLMEYVQDGVAGFLPRSAEQLSVEFTYKAEALKKEMVELTRKHP